MVHLMLQPLQRYFTLPRCFRNHEQYSKALHDIFLWLMQRPRGPCPLPDATCHTGLSLFCCAGLANRILHSPASYTSLIHWATRIVTGMSGLGILVSILVNISTCAAQFSDVARQFSNHIDIPQLQGETPKCVSSLCSCSGIHSSQGCSLGCNVDLSNILAYSILKSEQAGMARATCPACLSSGTIRLAT